MIYADTDFFIALVKDDRLQDRGVEIALENEGEIYTSRATLLELLVISDRFEFDRMEALTYALEIASVPEDEAVLFQAADYMEQSGLTAFDAYHVAYADEGPIVSSDKSIGEVAADRIAIEETEPT
ncbi:PIN domain-containing protein [Natrinema versiforme]|uniref:PIN domain-containing protein n=1 Tax=Natrinema versiforme TaxID=88724 RepID=A0A4V1G006_9EURY|nr:PIN domain-containing protein [Natrinema versiforme]QCS43676.1 PIN domain-containing protein [Natrinema versiforme]